MLRSMRLTRYPHASFVGRIWELRHYLTACDAAYVALTKALEAALIIRETSVYRGRPRYLRPRGAVLLKRFAGNQRIAQTALVS
jgi:hypothetical protein